MIGAVWSGRVVNGKSATKVWEEVNPYITRSKLPISKRRWSKRHELKQGREKDTL
jgi:hypothetical protein